MCARCKSEHCLSLGLLQPLPIPSQACQQIAIDFIERLPKSKGKDYSGCNLQVYKMLTFYPFSTHFLPLVLLKFLWIPFVDKIITSLFWKELFRKMGTSLSHSSAYHSQNDGQSERLNQCLEGYLRCLSFQKPHSWLKWLPMAEWWYNTSHHSALKMSF